MDRKAREKIKLDESSKINLTRQLEDCRKERARKYSDNKKFEEMQQKTLERSQSSTFSDSYDNKNELPSAGNTDAHNVQENNAPRDGHVQSSAENTHTAQVSEESTSFSFPKLPDRLETGQSTGNLRSDGRIATPSPPEARQGDSVVPSADQSSKPSTPSSDQSPTATSARKQEAKVSEQPKPSKPDWLAKKTDAREVLDWLLSAKLGEELMDNYGWGKYPGFCGTIEVTLKKITANDLCIYKNKNNDTYYITTKDKGYKYSKEGFESQDTKIENNDKELIRKLVSNFNKIEWDLPKIHAIKTVEKEKNGKNKDGNLSPGKQEEKAEILITDNNEEVEKNMQKPGKGWEPVLPWAADGIELSRNEKDYKEKKEFYEAYENFSNQYKNFSGRWSICQKILGKLYYTSEKDSNELQNKYLQIRNRFKELIVAKNYFALNQEPSTYIQMVEGTIEKSEKLKELVGKDIREFKSLVVEWNTQDKIKDRISQLGFKLKGKEVRFDIEGDLYLPKQGGDILHITKKKQDDQWVNADEGKLYDEKIDEIENKLHQATLDLKVYVIESKDGGILITDKESRVKEEIKNDGKMALPGTQTGIELSSNQQEAEEQKEFYIKFIGFCNNKKFKNTYNRLCGIEYDFAKHYSDASGDVKQKLGEFYGDYRQSLRNLITEHDSILPDAVNTYEIDLKNALESTIKPSEENKPEESSDVTGNASSSPSQKNGESRKENTSGIGKKTNDKLGDGLDRSGERGKGILNELRDSVLSMFKSKLEEMFGKLPGWGDMEVKIEIEGINDKKLNVYQDEKGQIYMTSLFDSPTKTVFKGSSGEFSLEKENDRFKYGMPLDELELRKIEPKGEFNTEQIQWILPELYVLQRSIQAENGGNPNVEVLLTDKEKVDGSKHLGTIESFVGNQEGIKKIVESKFTEIDTKLREEQEKQKKSSQGAENGDGTSETEDEKHDKSVDRETHEASDTSTNSPENLKKRIEEDIAVTRAYYDMLSKVEGVQLPNADDDRLAPQNIDNIKSEEHQDLLEKIKKLNTSLREAAEASVGKMPSNAEKSNEEDIDEEDIKSFRLALENAIDVSKACHSFAMNWDAEYKPCFNFSEPWLQNSIRRLGIEPENIHANIVKSHAKLLDDKFVHESIQVTSYSKGRQLSRSESKKIAYKCQKDEIVDKFERVIRASADLKYFYDKLNDGVPCDEWPPKNSERFGGRKVTQVSGATDNCLIRSLLKGAHPKWEDSEIEKQILKARKYVNAKLLERKANNELLDVKQYTDEYLKDWVSKPINPTSDDGELLINYLRSKEAMVEDPITKKKVHLLDPKRDIFVYKYNKKDNKGKIQHSCTRYADNGSANNHPYVIIHEDFDGRWDNGHYWAVVDMQDKAEE